MMIIAPRSGKLSNGQDVRLAHNGAERVGRPAAASAGLGPRIRSSSTGSKLNAGPDDHRNVVAASSDDSPPDELACNYGR